MSEIELRYEILRLLRLKGEAGDSTSSNLKEIALATGQRERDVRRVCAVMEALEYIRGHHSAGGDVNPSYQITVEGLVMLHKQEHIYGKSFFDEATKGTAAAPPAGGDASTITDNGPASARTADRTRRGSS